VFTNDCYNDTNYIGGTTAFDLLLVELRKNSQSSFVR